MLDLKITLLVKILKQKISLTLTHQFMLHNVITVHKRRCCNAGYSFNQKL